MNTSESAPRRAEPGRRTIEPEPRALSWRPAAPITTESPAQRRRRLRRQIGGPALALVLLVVGYLGAIELSQMLLQPRQSAVAGRTPSAACLSRADAQFGA